MNISTPRTLRLPRAPMLVLAGLVALVLAAWIALALVFPPARARALLQAQLSRSLNREVRFDDVALRLYPPVRLTARNLRIGEPGGLARGAALSAEALNLDLDAMALLGRRLVVRRLVLDHPAIHYLVTADGRSNFDSLAASKRQRQSTPMDLDVTELTVRGGHVLVDDLRAKRRTAFALDSRLSFSSVDRNSRIATSGHTTITELATGPIEARRLADLNPSLAKLVWVIEHDGRYEQASGRLTLASLSLQMGRARVVLFGTVDHPGPRALLALRARGQEVDLSHVLEHLSIADAKALHGVHGGGRLAFDLGIRGALRPGGLPDLVGTMTVADGVFAYPGAPPVEGVRFTARFSPDMIDIGDLRARVSDQPIRAQVNVRQLVDPVLRFALQGNVDLAAIAPLVAPKDVKLAGRADVNVRGSGRARDPGSIGLDGRAQLAGVSVEAPTLPKKIQGIAAAIEFSPARATVRGFTARAGQSSFKMNADVGRPLALMAPRGKVAPAALEFTFLSPHLDLAELLPPGPGEPIKLNARGGGRVQIDRLINGKLDVRNVAMNVSLEPAVFTIPTYALEAYGGRIRGSARLDFTSPTGLAYRIQGQADGMQAESFLGAWTPVRKGVLTGTFDSAFDLTGDGLEPAQVKRSLSAQGFAEFLEGQIGGPALDAIAEATRTPAFRELKFKDAHVPFRIERGRVVTDSVRLATTLGEWRLAGAIGFDGALDYAVSASVPADVAARLGVRPALAAGALSDEKGRVLIDLRLTGSAKSPRVTWNTRSMRERLAGRAGSVLAEQRDRIREELKRQVASGGVDSIVKALPKISGKNVGKDLEKQGRGLLEGFFGKKKPVKIDTLSSPVRAPRDTAARDTARR